MKIPCLSIAIVLAFTATAFAQVDPSNKIVPDVVYGHKDGLALTMDVFYPDAKPNGAGIMLIVSGGWYSKWSPPEQVQRLLQPYLNKGYTAFAIRHGSSPRYSIPEAVGDVRQAVRFVHQNAERFKVDPRRIGVMGNSAGGHLSLMIGTTGDDGKANARNQIDRFSSRVAAVVAFVPPTDLRVAVWEAPESLPAYRGFPALDLPLDAAAKFSPLVHVTSDDAPSLVVMGADDTLVPPKHGTWIESAFREQKVDHKLIVVPDAGHALGGANNRSMLVKESLEWFDRFLTEPKK